MPALLKSVHKRKADLIKKRDVYLKLLLREEHREVQEQIRQKGVQFEYFVDVFVAENSAPNLNSNANFILSPPSYK
jgi:polysaccharide pyruvyl transferase WcaK-like protein